MEVPIRHAPGLIARNIETLLNELVEVCAHKDALANAELLTRVLSGAEKSLEDAVRIAAKSAGLAATDEECAAPHFTS